MADTFPASFAQQRLWFLDRLSPGNPTYNNASALWLRGALDRDALARALAEIAQRHESLRTTFAMEDGRELEPVPELPHFIRVGEAHSRAMRAYVARPWDGRAVLFRSRRPLFSWLEDADLGWDRLIAGGGRRRTVGGLGAEIIRGARARHLAAALRAELTRPRDAATTRDRPGAL